MGSKSFPPEGQRVKVYNAITEKWERGTVEYALSAQFAVRLDGTTYTTLVLKGSPWERINDGKG